MSKKNYSWPSIDESTRGWDIISNLNDKPLQVLHQHHTGDAFLKKIFQFPFEPPSKGKHSNLKRDVMLLIVGKCGLDLSKEERNGISEISLIKHLIEEGRVSEFLQRF